MNPTSVAGGTSRAYDAGPVARTRTCPCCEGSVYRVPRRFVDMLLNIWIPVRRYRCRSTACGWEGNVRKTRHSLWRRGLGPYDGVNVVLEPSRMNSARRSGKAPR